MQDLGLTDEQRLIRDSVRALARERFAPGAARADREYRPPVENLGVLAAHGYTGLFIPEAYGGAGLGLMENVLVAEAIARSCANTAILFSCTDGATPRALLGLGSEAHKRKYLPRIVKGEVLTAWSMSEPNAGSDVVSMKLRADFKGDRWVLNGSKMWITNGPDADTLVVYAKTEPELGARGVTAFLIEKGMKGFSIAQKLDKLGMRGSHTGELVFQNVEVPEANILGGLNMGAKVLMSGLDYERAVLTGGPLGIMQSVMDNVIPYIHDRKQFGQSIGEFQLIQGKVADMYTVLQAGRSFAYTVAKNLDLLGTDHVRQVRKDCASVILWTAEKATWMAGEGVQIFGGNGYINEYPLGRLWRDAKLYEIGAGTSEIRRMLIGRELFAETC